MAKTGRPTILASSGHELEKQKDEFQKLCGLQCTLIEIAAWFECSEDTVERWCKRAYKMSFADCMKKYSARGKMSLRRAQFRLAEKSAAMAIFLGKQYLGQKDSIQYEDKESLSRLDAILTGFRREADKNVTD